MKHLFNLLLLTVLSLALTACGGRVQLSTLLTAGSSLACTLCTLATKRTTPVCPETSHEEEASQREGAQPLEAHLEEASEGEAAHPHHQEASGEAGSSEAPPKVVRPYDGYELPKSRSTRARRAPLGWGAR